MNKKSARLNYLDYLRVIACFSVIIVHVSAIGIVSCESGSMYHKGIIFLNRLFKYTTPVFLFLSGITSFYSYRNKKYKYLGFLKKRLKTVIVPFVIWSSVYYFIQIYRGSYNFNLLFYIKNLILGNMSYHLYFIPILLQMYLLSGIINYSFKKLNNNIVLLIALAINIIAMEIFFPFSDRIFIKYILFYVMGVYLTKEYDFALNISYRYRNIFSLIFFVSTFLYSVFYYFQRYDLMNYAWFIFSISGIIFLLNISIILERKNSKQNTNIRKLSKSTYYIYLIHPLILSIIVRIVDSYNYSLTTSLFLYLIFTISISTIISLFYNSLKNKYLKSQEKITFKNVK